LDKSHQNCLAKALVTISMLEMQDLQYAWCSQYCSWARIHPGLHHDCASYVYTLL